MLKYILIGAACVFGSLSAHAADVSRKIDFSQVVVGPEGPFKQCAKFNETGDKCIEAKDLTLGMICAQAAVFVDHSAAPSPLLDQIAHGKLASKLIDAKELDLTASEVKYLEDQIAKQNQNPIMVYNVIKVLDPAVIEK